MKWLSDGSIGDIVMKFENGGYVQQNKVTGKIVPLMTISEWGKHQPTPGSFGIFENPVYRKLIEKQPGKSKDSGPLVIDE